MGYYCTKCYHQGHIAVVCRVGEICQHEVKQKEKKKTWKQKKKQRTKEASGSREGSNSEETLVLSNPKVLSIAEANMDQMNGTVVEENRRKPWSRIRSCQKQSKSKKEGSRKKIKVQIMMKIVKKFGSMRKWM